MDPECRSRLRQDSAFSFSDPESLLNFGSNKSFVVISEVKTWVNYGRIDGNRSLNRSRILKFEKFPDPD